MGNIRTDTVNLKVSIDGAEAGGQLRDLKNEARNLKIAIDSLTPGTEEYIEVASKLKGVNDKLAEHNALTRGAVQQAKSLEAEFKDIKLELTKLTPGTQAYIDKFKQLSGVDAKLKAHEASLHRIDTELNGLPKKVNPLVDIFNKGVAASVAFFAVDRVIRWGVQLKNFVTGGTVALEDMRDKTNRTFGDAISIVEDFAKVNAQSLGVTEEKYASLASTIGASLVPLGFMREETAKMSTEALGIVGPLNEWAEGNKTIEETTTTVQKALLGQTNGLKEYGIAISESDIKNKLAAEGLDKLTGKALAQAKAQAILKLITEKSRDAQAEFAASAEDAGRATGRISQFFAQLKESTLSSLLTGYTKLTNAVANVLSPLKRHSDITRELQAQFNLQINTLKAGNLTEQNRIQLIKEINTKYGEYLPNLLTEKSSLIEIEAAQTAVNKSLLQKITILAAEEAVQDVINKQVKNQIENAKLAHELEKAKNRLAEEAAKPDHLVTAADVLPGANSSGKDRKFLGDAQAGVDKFTDAIKENAKERDQLADDLKLVSEVATKLGVNLDAILNPKTPDGGTDGDPSNSKLSKEKKRFNELAGLIEEDKQTRIRANEAIVQSDEQAALQREVIELESSNKIAQLQIDIFSKASEEKERLTVAQVVKLEQEITDSELKILEKQNKIELDNTINLINKERELRLDELNDLGLLAQEKARKAEIINKQSNLDIEKAQLQSIDITTDAYFKAAREIGEHQAEIAKLIEDDDFQSTIENLEIQKSAALHASRVVGEQLAIDEEELQKERLHINLIYDRKILEQRKKLFAANSPEAAAIQTEIDENDRQQSDISFKFTGAEGPSSSGKDHDDKVKLHEQQAKDAALSTAHNVADSIFQVDSDRIENTLRLELDAIDRVADARLKAAEGDSVLTKKIQAEARRDREAAEKKAARDRKKVARSEAVVQGALAVVEALPNLFAAGAAVIATGIQLSVIDSQSFRYGGHTGPGKYRDSTGKKVAGIVHEHEWVANEELVTDPVSGPIIHQLERYRVAKRGFADGGYTTVSTRPLQSVQYVTNNTSASSDPEMLKLLREISSAVRSWPKEIKANVAYTDIESKKSDIDYIRSLAHAS